MDALIGNVTMFPMPAAVDLRRDLGRLDLTPAAPEDIGVGYWDPRLFEVVIDCGLMRQNGILFGAMDYSHDIYVAELGASLSPIGMGHAVVAPHLSTCLYFPSGRHRPVEESIEAGDPCARTGGLDVLKKGRKASNYFLFVEGLRDLKKPT